MNKHLYIAPDIYDVEVCFESGFGISDTVELDLDYEKEMLPDD